MNASNQLPISESYNNKLTENSLNSNNNLHTRVSTCSANNPISKSQKQEINTSTPKNCLERTCSNIKEGVKITCNFVGYASAILAFAIVMISMSISLITTFFLLPMNEDIRSSLTTLIFLLPFAYVSYKLTTFLFNLCISKD